jgi:hypothetical protein
MLSKIYSFNHTILLTFFRKSFISQVKIINGGNHIESKSKLFALVSIFSAIILSILMSRIIFSIVILTDTIRLFCSFSSEFRCFDAAFVFHNSRY